MFIAAILEGATLDCPVMRVLIVAFYFPPAGGGGVQRTLKFCKFLPEHGVDVHVLTPHDPKWFARDEHLLEAIPATTTVHRCRFLGPRSTSRADALAGRSGLGRLGTEARFVYQRALIPDKATPWLATAVPAGIGVVRRHDIDVIMSTSPPASTHLVAEAIATATRRPFLADFRDSWLDNPHRDYDKAGVRAKRAVASRMAASVGRRAAALTAATGSIAQEIGHLHPDAAHKTTVIENGADFDDFAQLSYRPGDRFTIVHAGSFFGQRSPRPFLQALAGMLDRRADLKGLVLARFIGELRGDDRAFAHGLGIDGAWREEGFLPYSESIRAQRAADALLLLIPHAGGRGDTVLSGKVFEYVAACRPMLAAVPPSGAAANLIRSVGAGSVVDSDDVGAISAALERMVDGWQNGGLADVEQPDEVRDRLSRAGRAGELAAVLRRVAG
jgi:glycosyltransferase involved in cell wall biosynthesis